MVEFPLAVVGLMTAVALWAVTGAMAIFARRLEKQVRTHELLLEVERIKKARLEARAAENHEYSDVEILPEQGHHAVERKRRIAA